MKKKTLKEISKFTHQIIKAEKTIKIKGGDGSKGANNRYADFS